MKILMKRITALWIVIISIISAVPCVAEEVQENVASIVFTETGAKLENIRSWAIPTNDPKFSMDGLQLIRDGADQFLYINVDDAFIKNEEGTNVSVTVEYMDINYGFFTLSWDGKSKADTESDEKIILYNTGELKSYTFDLPDAVFTGRLNGFDFRVGLWNSKHGLSDQDVFIKSVTVKEGFPVRPIKISAKSDRVGNIFGPDMEKKMTVNLQNITNKAFSSKVNYEILTPEDIVVDSGEIPATVDANGDTEFEVELKVDKYNIYRLHLDVVSETDGIDKEFTDTKEFEFSLVNLTPEGGKMNDMYAFCTHFAHYKSTPEVTSQLIRQIGVPMHRDEIYWQGVEAQKGKMAIDDYLYRYPFVMKENGVGTLMILSYGNTLYADDVYTGGVPNTDESIEAYARYCEYMAKTYKDTIKYFEIWNEFNEATFNRSMEPPETYAKILKVVVPRIKAANPDAVIVAGAAETPIDWFTRLFDAGAYDYIDIISVHPYDWGYGFRHDVLSNRMEQVKELMLKYGEMKPIWYTEMGYASSTNSKGVTEREQAIAAVQMPIIMQAEKIGDVLFWYDFQDDGTRGDFHEHRLGLIRTIGGVTVPYAAKPSYLAVAGMNRLLAGAEYKTSIVTEDKSFAYLFENDGKNVITLWSEAEENTHLSLNLGSGSVEQFDMYSNSQGILSSSDGTYDIDLGEEPIYLVGNFTKFEQTAAKLDVSTSKQTIAPGDRVIIKVSDKDRRNLDIKISESVKYEVLSSERKADGSYEVIVKDKSINVNEYNIGYSVYSDGKLLKTADLDVFVQEPFTATLKTEPYSKGNYDRWKAIITIKNNSLDTVLNGVCTLNEPVTKNNSIGFKKLKPGQTRSIFINLPEMIKKRNLDMKVTVELDYGYVTELTQTVDFTIGGKSSPVIDGKVNVGEYNGNWFYVDTEDRVEYDSWRGVSDKSYRANIGWDEDNFYIAVLVNDDVHCQENKSDTMWQGDSVQFALREEGSTEFMQSTLSTVGEFTEIAIGLTPEGPKAFRHAAMYSDLAIQTELEDYEITIIPGNVQTIYEIKIPWSQIFKPGYKAKENSEYGFSMLVNENDGAGRLGWLQYNSGIGWSKDITEFGKLHLY